MSELLRLQQEFTRNISFLLIYADRMGFDITFGEAWRSPETAKIYAQQGRGISNSLHVDRLAIDLNLFRDGTYLATSSDHRVLGEFWKSLNPLNRWGGDFAKPDGNHYSMEYRGRK
jgi:hypothetical protein